MKKIYIILFTVLLAFSCAKEEPVNIKLAGPVFGTGFNIQYHSEESINYQNQFDSLFAVINQSLSTYIPDSDISKWNRNEPVEVDAHFIKVFNTSKKIFKETKGVFDPTIGNVVNAWNFGPDQNKFLTDSSTIEKLMLNVGFNNVVKMPNRFIRPDSAYLDFNAIAKGYGVDVIGEFLESKNVTDYLVEIGGEIRVRGINLDKKSPWKVGIDDPNFEGEQSYSKIIALQEEAMATSGTYRKFKIDDNGNRYAHIIDTKTGYPTKTNILSVSVIAPDCMTADGYATAFQAMGIEKVTWFLNSHPELKAYFIYEDQNKVLQTISLNGFSIH